MWTTDQEIDFDNDCQQFRYYAVLDRKKQGLNISHADEMFFAAWRAVTDMK